MSNAPSRLLIVAALAASAVLVGVGAPCAVLAQDRSPEEQAIIKPIDNLVKLIKLGKFDLASKSLDHGAMAKDLLRDTWATMKPEQQQEFVDGFAFLMQKLSFPKVKDNFEYLDAILYGELKVEGDRAKVPSTVVVHHELKKKEYVLEYVMLKSEAGWRVLDVFVAGESTLDGIREDQIEELLEEGGVPKLLETLRKKVEEAKKDEPKKDGAK